MASLIASQRARTGRDRPYFGTQQFHAKDIWPLPADVFFAHVDNTIQPNAHAVAVATPCWPCARFRNHAAFAHPQREQSLPNRVVDLMGAV